MPQEPKQKVDIKAVLDRQLAPDRHELKTAYVNTFEMIENSNIESSGKTGNRNKKKRQEKLRQTR